jgi:hypothetical protein
MGPGSIAGSAGAAGVRPSSGPKSVISAASGATSKSKVSLASAAAMGTMLAKDKLAQVGARASVSSVAASRRADCTGKTQFHRGGLR